MNKVFILMSSARKNGNTNKLVKSFEIWARGSGHRVEKMNLHYCHLSHV